MSSSWVLLIGAALIAAGGVVFVSAVSRPPPNHPTFSVIPPSPSPGQPVIDGFLLLVRTSPLAYHVVATGTVEFEGEQGSFESVGDVVDDDLTFQIKFVSAVETISAAFITADGRSYVRLLPDGSWQLVIGPPTTKAFAVENVLAGFQYRRELRYVGLEQRDGVALHHLQVTEWMGKPPFHPLGYSAKLEQTSFDIWVNDAAVPQEAMLVATLEVSPLGETSPEPIDVTLTYRFSQFGTVVDISPPI